MKFMVFLKNIIFNMKKLIVKIKKKKMLLTGCLVLIMNSFLLKLLQIISILFIIQDFVSFLFEHEYYSAIVDYLCPLLLHEDQFNLTESEKKVLQEKEHILIRSCFYAKKTEYLEEIHPLLQQYTSQEDSLLFLLRTAYEVDQHSYFNDYSTIALSSFPSSRNIVLSLV